MNSPRFLVICAVCAALSACDPDAPEGEIDPGPDDSTGAGACEPELGATLTVCSLPETYSVSWRSENAEGLQALECVNADCSVWTTEQALAFPIEIWASAAGEPHEDPYCWYQWRATDGPFVVGELDNGGLSHTMSGWYSKEVCE